MIPFITNWWSQAWKKMYASTSSIRMRFILIHLLWHTVRFDGVILCEFCYCRTVLFCSVTVVRTFQLCGDRKADIFSWLFYHSLWTILWYVFKIFMNSFMLSIHLFSDFHRSMSCIVLYLSDGDSIDGLFYWEVLCWS